MTLATSENVHIGTAGLRSHGDICAPSDPAMGALELSPERRLKAIKALNREVRRIKLRLYLDYFRLRLMKLGFQFMASLAEPVSNLNRALKKCFG
ncbi:hypothetical protein [Nitratireductor alexandrii]|uniref:hypothetical protein n=1 Tax=Nitratireductor alexandrii TaxID=2448161 RepID=UPI000FD966DE|nr:hypothetical protein [Nitratireductor alexandrii]